MYMASQNFILFIFYIFSHRFFFVFFEWKISAARIESG